MDTLKRRTDMTREPGIPFAADGEREAAGADIRNGRAPREEQELDERFLALIREAAKRRWWSVKAAERKGQPAAPTRGQGRLTDEDGSYLGATVGMTAEMALERSTEGLAGRLALILEPHLAKPVKEWQDEILERYEGRDEALVSLERRLAAVTRGPLFRAVTSGLAAAIMAAAGAILAVKLLAG
ncbi:MAG: hypothetical protein LBR80_12125 [Deltaproteobacteria bacterium]|jgi:hypothetical protein|nr:hypothetical protein [Deltaproteobacteria bacterium]